MVFCSFLSVFFFTDTATTEIYTLSLHDALPISMPTCRRSRGRAWSTDVNRRRHEADRSARHRDRDGCRREPWGDRKSTRLNSSHTVISYAVFCLKKKKKKKRN